MKISDKLFAADRPVIGVRCVHLDLKGAPPSPGRLIKLLKVFATARYNAVLVEWEDSFPWTVDRRFRSETAYSPATVKSFVKKAGELGIELIPLVQCLGHMETPLRLPEYAALRENPCDETVLNPLAPGARGLVEKMMADVLRLMPNIKRFHLGGDEALTFGTHPDTKQYVTKHGKGALYLHHVEPLLNKLAKRNIRPMLWHDMMRDWESSDLQRLARKADLVVWGYSGHPYAMQKHCNREMIERFAEHKIVMWGGTAYKGADGMEADVPNIARREENALGWVEVAERHGFKGVIATAWSRYCTSGCQNEPIDGALDSAFNVGVILHDGKPPLAGIEACRKVLGRIGEGRAVKTGNILAKMSAARNNAWHGIRALRHLMVTIKQDRRRLPAFWMARHLKNVRDEIMRVEGTANDLRKALGGLMEPVWVERYIAERLQSLRGEFAALEAETRQLSPAAYGALFDNRMTKSK
ncbi:MAG: family 20 glycosylhydrolase [Verrucomicrobia bacterium]|nr:family 20 glycosylhydrolase [Verrucomicrobiota bacterium]